MVEADARLVHGLPKVTLAFVEELSLDQVDVPRLKVHHQVIVLLDVVVALRNVIYLSFSLSLGLAPDQRFTILVSHGQFTMSRLKKCVQEEATCSSFRLSCCWR